MPRTEIVARQRQHAARRRQRFGHLDGRRARERMPHIGEIGPQRRDPPVVEAFQRRPAGRAPAVDLVAVFAPPCRQITDAPGDRRLARPWRIDDHGVQRLFQLRHHARARRDGADPVAGDTVGFGEAVQLQDVVAPVGAAEQFVRAAPVSGEKIAIGLVHHQPDFSRFSEIGEGGDAGGRIDCAGGIVGRHQHDGAGTGVDQFFRHRHVGHEAVLGAQRQHAGFDAEHLQRHMVVEIPGSGQQYIVAGLGHR